MRPLSTIEVDSGSSAIFVAAEEAAADAALADVVKTKQEATIVAALPSGWRAADGREQVLQEVEGRKDGTTYALIAESLVAEEREAAAKGFVEEVATEAASDEVSEQTVQEATEGGGGRGGSATRQ